MGNTLGRAFNSYIEAKSMFYSGKLNFNLSFDRILNSIASTF